MLAVRAEVCSPIPHQNALDGTMANRASLPFPVGNLKIKLGTAELPAGADVGINAGAFIANG